MNVRAEFAVYPFREGEVPPPYVQAAIDVFLEAGLHVDIGLLGQVVSGEKSSVLDALRVAETAALNAGASRVAVSIESVK